MITAIEEKNHKGQPCPYQEDTTCCKEFYCSECEIFAQYIEQMGEISSSDKE